MAKWILLYPNLTVCQLTGHVTCPVPQSTCPPSMRAQQCGVDEHLRRRVPRRIKRSCSPLVGRGHLPSTSDCPGSCSTSASRGCSHLTGTPPHVAAHHRRTRGARTRRAPSPGEGCSPGSRARGLLTIGELPARLLADSEQGNTLPAHAR